MRPLISYDDITVPQAASPKHQANLPTTQPPAKKRKTAANPRQGGSGGGRPPQNYQSVQHWDDPGNQGMQMNYDDAPETASSSVKSGRNEASVVVDEAGYEEGEEEEEEESRELTHGDIWDDSALIEAWNSAAAEYEAFHGPGKDWKQEPVKKSPLWYNVPPAKGKSKAGASKAAPSAQNGIDTHEIDEATNGAADSAPLNFDTFVPSHDPSLASAAAGGALLAVPSMDGISGAGTGAEIATVSQDEAFSRAMTAMYWSGYWTAVYNCRRSETVSHGDVVSGKDAEAELEEGEDDDDEDEDEDEDMLPAQR